MANAKKSEELDAVTAAYESISAKLDDLRKKQAELSDDADESSKRPNSSKSSKEADDDPDEIEEFDSEDEDPPKSPKHPKDPNPSEEEPLDPLPGTEDEEPEEETPKKQVYKANDPLDDEAAEEDEKEENIPEDEDPPKRPNIPNSPEEDIPTLRERGAALNPNADEMETWEKMNSEEEDTPKRPNIPNLSEDDEESEAQPTYQPLSQQDFQARLRRPEPEGGIEEPENSPKSLNRPNPSMDEPDSLDDLADETVEPASFSDQRSRPAAVEGLEDNWGIRHLKPRHNESSYDNQESHYDEIPQRELRQSPHHEEENYFDRRNEPLPRKRASIWHLIILILIGLGVIGATVYFLKYQFNEPAKPTPTPEISSPSPVPTPTPEPPKEVSDRSQFTVRVLNGTTKSGWAGDILKKLKDAGFKTDRSGNATNSAFTQTIIRVKDSSDSAALINTITKDLGSDFSPTSDTSLKSSDKADAEIVLGQK